MHKAGGPQCLGRCILVHMLGHHRLFYIPLPDFKLHGQAACWQQIDLSDGNVPMLAVPLAFMGGVACYKFGTRHLAAATVDEAFIDILAS